MAGGHGSRAWRIALGAVVVAGPAVVTWGLVARLFHATLFEYRPFASDEIAYQRQIAAFVQAGFHSGYFNTLERPAPFELSHFAVHGPAFPVIYGLMGRVFGWHLYSGPLFNLGVLALATTIFLVMTRPSRAQIAAAGVVILTSWWLVLMASITMQESLNQAVLIVIAGCAVRLLDPGAGRRGRLLLAALAMLAISSVLRPTNWIVAVPLVIVAMSWQRPLRLALATLGAALGIPLFWLLWRYISAPIPGLAIEWSRATGSGATGRITAYFVDQLGENIDKIFDVTDLIEAPFFQHVMFESAVIAAACGVLAARGAGRRAATVRTDLFNALTLSLALAAFLGFYFDSDASISRVTAPFLLMALLVLIGTRMHSWIVAAAIAANLLAAPSFLAIYRAWRVDMFRYSDADYRQFRDQLAPVLAYDPRRTPWCNTLLTTTYQREVLAVPAGMGLSYGRPASSLVPPIKSGYVLLTPDSVAEFDQKARLEPLTTTVLGELYVNRDAGCGSPAATGSP